MLNMGTTEIMVVVLVIVIFIGPKGIPKLVKDIRGWIKSLRSMVGDLTSTFDDMIKDTEFKETADLLKEARGFSPRKLLDPDGETEKSLRSLGKEVESATSASSELSSSSFSAKQSAHSASSTPAPEPASSSPASGSPASAVAPKRSNALLEEASSHLDSLNDKDPRA